jgi:hypothetical protein
MSARDPLRELEDALSFPVSPDFCARVRRQMASAPVYPRGFFVRQRLALAAAVVLAAGIGVLTTLQRQGIEIAQVSGPRLVVATQTPMPPAHETVAATEPVRALQPRARAVASQTASPYDTLVPDDQLHALDRLFAAMREGRATVPLAVSNDEVNDRGERVLRALVIEPVTIELLAGTPAEPIKNPGKDPNK